MRVSAHRTEPPAPPTPRSLLTSRLPRTDEDFTQALRIHLQRLITYAQSADISLQREVAERLANEAVKRSFGRARAASLSTVTRRAALADPLAQRPGRSKSWS